MKKDRSQQITRMMMNSISDNAKKDWVRLFVHTAPNGVWRLLVPRAEAQRLLYEWEEQPELIGGPPALDETKLKIEGVLDNPTLEKISSVITKGIITAIDVVELRGLALQALIKKLKEEQE